MAVTDIVATAGAVTDGVATVMGSVWASVSAIRITAATPMRTVPAAIGRCASRRATAGSGAASGCVDALVDHKPELVDQRLPLGLFARHVGRVLFRRARDRIAA